MRTTRAIRLERPIPVFYGTVRWVRALAAHNPLAVLSLGIILISGVAAIGGPALAPYDPFYIDSARAGLPPGTSHWFGTDNFGRDVFSRILVGARTSIGVGVTAMVIGTSLGSVIGILSAYRGGWLDLLVQRVVDGLMGFPILVLALAIAAALQPGVMNVVIAVSVVFTPRVARVLRSQALTIKERQYVDAAVAIGATEARVLLVHVLPGCMAPILILGAAEIGNAILIEASLSFLGAGIPPPNPSWGAMLGGNGQKYMVLYPWMAFFPGLAITLVVLAFSLFGDALRDKWDPRLRGR